MLIPNLITLLALCLGLTAIRLAIEGRMEAAVQAILFAALLDGIDGNLARFLKGTSRFGAELDSLADFVNFGCVPALVLYFWVLKDLKSLGWIVCLVFAIAMVLRLARFNVMLDDPTRPEWKKGFFVGMPARWARRACSCRSISASRACCGLHGAADARSDLHAADRLLHDQHDPHDLVQEARAAGQPELRDPDLRADGAAQGLLVSHTFETLAALVLLYLVTLPFSFARYKALERELDRRAGGGAGA